MKRADGTRLRHADVMYRIASHVMAKRSDAQNAITLNIPMEPITAYLREKSREGRPFSKTDRGSGQGDEGAPGQAGKEENLDGQEVGDDLWHTQTTVFTLTRSTATC